MSHWDPQFVRPYFSTNYTFVMFEIINIVKDIWHKNMQITERIWKVLYKDFYHMDNLRSDIHSTKYSLYPSPGKYFL